MRTETRTVRIGELLGPVDWEGFDWAEAMQQFYSGQGNAESSSY